MFLSEVSMSGFCILLSLSTLLFVPGIAYAGNSDLSNWLYNVATQVPSLIRLLIAVSYVSGFSFVMAAVMKFKRCAQGVTMMSSQEGISAPLVYLVVGTALLYFGGFVRVGSETLFGQGAVIAYQNSSLIAPTANSFEGIISPIIIILRLIGYIAFIKGLYILGRLGGHGAQPGTLSKGIVHIIGGILAINIEVTYVILLNTLRGPSI
jgi:intracellular multiplication protein IcmC